MPLSARGGETSEEFLSLFELFRVLQPRPMYERCVSFCSRLIARSCSVRPSVRPRRAASFYLSAIQVCSPSTSSFLLPSFGRPLCPRRRREFLIDANLRRPSARPFGFLPPSVRRGVRTDSSRPSLAPSTASSCEHWTEHPASPRPPPFSLLFLGY